MANGLLQLKPYVPPTERSALGQLLDAMRAAFPEEKRRAFALSMADPRNAELYEEGYEEGKRQGFEASFRDFKDRVADTLDLLYSLVDPEILPDLIAGSVTAYLQPVGTPLPLELRRRFEAALWYQQLRSFAPFFEVLDRKGVLETFRLVASEVVAAMREAGPAWVDGFFALTGQPREQGRYAGYLIGRACGEVFFLAVEEVAQVPLFDAPAEEGQAGEVEP